MNCVSGVGPLHFPSSSCVGAQRHYIHLKVSTFDCCRALDDTTKLGSSPKAQPLPIVGFLVELGGHFVKTIVFMLLFR